MRHGQSGADGNQAVWVAAIGAIAAIVAAVIAKWPAAAPAATPELAAASTPATRHKGAEGDPVALIEKEPPAAAAAARGPFATWDGAWKGAQEGNCTAENNVAAFLARGKGVERDERKAAEWYKKAAECGAPMAQYVWGTYLELGLAGTKVDPKAAVTWYRKAATAGEPAAVNALRRLGVSE